MPIIILFIGILTLTFVTRILINLTFMKKWMVFVLAFACVVLLIYAGVDALSRHQERMGMFLTFVGGMTVIGLALDVIKHLKPRRWM